MMAQQNNMGEAGPGQGQEARPGHTQMQPMVSAVLHPNGMKKGVVKRVEKSAEVKEHLAKIGRGYTAEREYEGELRAAV